MARIGTSSALEVATGKRAEGGSIESRHPSLRVGLNPGCLAGLAEPLELLAASALAGLLIVRLATHLLAEAASLAELPESTDGILDRLAGTDP
jgi:hypothetical protein